MKTIKMMAKTNFLLLLASFLLSVSLHAADQVEVTKLNKTSVVIEAKDISQNDKIVIRNQKGEMLFIDNLDKSENYRKIYQFSLFDNGVYFISYQNSKENYHFNIIKESKHIKLININENKYSFKPIVKKNNKKAHILFTNIDLDNVKLTISDSSGEVLSSNRFKDELFVKKSYDLSRLPSGNYSLNIQVDDQSFTHVLSVQ
jgi:hypothetical protein